jgi:long-chain acyl-CoA synthetase
VAVKEGEQTMGNRTSEASTSATTRSADLAGFSLSGAYGFWEIAQAEPTRLAVIDAEGNTTTYGELLATANRLAHGLRGLGLTMGDAVAVLLPNEPLFLAAYLAALQVGLYLVPINWHLTAREIAYILGDCEAKVLIANPTFADAARTAADEANLPLDRRFGSVAFPGFAPIDDLLDGQPSTAPANRQTGQRMLYTSGTTGRPKGVRRPVREEPPETNLNLGWSFYAGMGYLEAGPGVHLVAGPLYHGGPIVTGTLALHLGHSVILMTRWSPEETLDLIARYSVTNIHMVPTMFHRLLALPEAVRAAASVSTLTNVVHGAATCPIEVKRRMLEWWGPVLYEYYAATEGGATTVSPHEWLAHPETVGRPIPGHEITIVREDGTEAPTGEPGLIYIKDVRPFEYHRDPEKTAANRRGDSFTVGDIGYFDAGGWLYLCDRRTDLIISGGVNIYPAESEGVLLTHPAVRDVAVIGVPDAAWGQQVRAVVEPAAGVTADATLATELIAFCRANLAHYKCPRSVVFSPALPRTDTGKLSRAQVREQYGAPSAIIDHKTE